MKEYKMHALRLSEVAICVFDKAPDILIDIGKDRIWVPRNEWQDFIDAANCFDLVHYLRNKEWAENVKVSYVGNERIEISKHDTLVQLDDESFIEMLKSVKLD